MAFTSPKIREAESAIVHAGNCTGGRLQNAAKVNSKVRGICNFVCWRFGGKATASGRLESRTSYLKHWSPLRILVITQEQHDSRTIRVLNQKWRNGLARKIFYFEPVRRSSSFENWHWSHEIHSVQRVCCPVSKYRKGILFPPPPPKFMHSTS